MSDILDLDAVLSATVLKSCKNCSHARGDHADDKRCKIKKCTCEKFGE
ncbi:MAG: hypothetical protein ACFFCX_02275 [Candidatus Sifarchaeia archaeon]